jgi:hypothetical protein
LVGRTGNDLMRRPVAWLTALAIAAETPTTPISRRQQADVDKPLR